VAPLAGDNRQPCCFYLSHGADMAPNVTMPLPVLTTDRLMGLL